MNPDQIVAESLSHLTGWPLAFVIVAAMSCATIAVIGMFIAVTGSQWPWEK